MRIDRFLVAAVMLTVALAPLATGQSTDATQTLDLHCNFERNDLASFEAWYAHQKRDSRKGCWAHFGHHHYFVGRDNVYALQGGSGFVRSVEQQLSPPVEPGDPAVPPNTAVPIEVSMDGTSWEPVDNVNYEFLFDFRQNIEFTFDADGQHFRYIRIRNPLSAAQGLSGYIDKSTFQLDVTVVGAADQPTVSQQTVSKSCRTDIMEAVYPGHPCWFGGIDRWDAPSFFHTYPLGGIAELDSAEGTVVTNNFRIGPFDAELVPDTDAEVFVQTSINGTEWETVHTFPVVHGVPTSFSTGDLADEDARFVRFATSRHPRWTIESDFAAKHPEGYFVLSDLTLTGKLPG